MKNNASLFGIALMLGVCMLSGCQGSDPNDHEKSPSTSESSSFGVESHSFEGKGSHSSGDEGDGFVKTDSVELYGQYLLKWEVAGNNIDPGGDSATFELILKGTENVSVVTELIDEGSGTEKVQLREPGEYHAEVFSMEGSEWSVTLKRTCAGVPPECPTKEEPWPGELRYNSLVSFEVVATAV